MYMYIRRINVFSNNNNISRARVYTLYNQCVYRACVQCFFPFTGFDLMYQRARPEAPDYKHIALYRANGHGY